MRDSALANSLATLGTSFPTYGTASSRRRRERTGAPAAPPEGVAQGAGDYAGAAGLTSSSSNIDERPTNIDAIHGKWLAMDCGQHLIYLVCQQIAPPPVPPPAPPALFARFFVGGPPGAAAGHRT